ncbi:hypothetical protein BYT27DRAFT_7209910 [Phlegmacium glaucopus]|nr:hypothetical protein BYT27DRAFT_7209910 [Phlegmacium glaucopus]
MVDSSILPPISKVLAATIGITFVGPKNLPERSMPKMFRVRRSRMREALEWLKANNPLYSDISISPSRLAQLLEDGVPYELMVMAKHSTDTNMLYAEQDGYVPPQDISDGEEDEEVDTETNEELMNIDDDETDLFMEPGVVPLSHLGVVDVDGIDITESELMAHALANCCEVKQDKDYLIRRGSAFVNEYVRVDPVTGQRNNGGPSDTNHLLGCFPTLFPYRQGGFEIDQAVNVPYEVHEGPTFPIPGVWSVSKKTKDLTKASQEETRGVPFSNPAVRMLRSHLSAVKAKVQGSDESHKLIRAKIWGTNILHNPPSLWVTLNPSDMQDPITQVFAGVEINIDAFCETAGLTSTDRALNVASDPYASAKFFHFLIETILEALFGITKRQEGIFGIVKSYVGTVEAQGCGSLHLHLLLWLDGAPTAKELMHALKNDMFLFELSEAQDNWVDSNGGWGPKRLCGFLNNWNPSLLMTIQANHDVKLFMNGRDTNVLTWYITNYASKKQQREFSGPEIMSYLMGWGDRFESHHYIAIYSDVIVSSLKNKYPGLRETRREGVSEGANREHGHIITMVSGVITLKDQLNEYMYRGEEIIDMDFLTFILETYDGKAEKNDDFQVDQQQAIADISQRTWGRPPNRQAPYQQGFNKSGQCRIFQTEGHETLPQFIGNWLPRSDRPQDREIYSDGAERTINFEEDAALDNLMDDSMAFQHEAMPSDATEEEIAQAYESRGYNEYGYGMWPVLGNQG